VVLGPGGVDLLDELVGPGGLPGISQRVSPEDFRRTFSRLSASALLAAVSVGDTKMSFFGTLLNIGKRILGIGTAPAAAAVAPVATTAVRAGFGAAGLRAGAARIARAGTGLVAGGAAFGLGQSIFEGGGGDGALAIQGMGGNGMSFRRTIVQTIRSNDGVIIKQIILPGAPHLMNKDIQVARRVINASRKLGGRIPKKIVRRSRKSMLMDQVMENALERASCPAPLALAAPRTC